MDDMPHDEASNTAAVQGVVIVDGPDGVAVTLTPEAAIETSDRLLHSGLQANGQQVAQREAAEANQSKQP